MTCFWTLSTFFSQFLSTVMCMVCPWHPRTINLPATTPRIMASLFRGSHCLWCPSGNPCFPEGRPGIRASCSQFHTHFLPASQQTPVSSSSHINGRKTPRSSVKTSAGSFFLLWTPQHCAALCVGFLLYLIGEKIVVINKTIEVKFFCLVLVTWAGSTCKELYM